MEGILALMIPIIAIVVWSPIGKAISLAIVQGAGAHSDDEIAALTARVQQLELKALEQEQQVQLLQENSSFYKQLLESKQEISKPF
jgi:hypothetical protein